MKEISICSGTSLTVPLQSVKPENLPAFLSQQKHNLILEKKPFATYMRRKINEKGILRQNIFIAADISENYGYKLLSEEKRTKDRDTILKLCIAAHFTLEETQKALVLYGMAPLYQVIPRDIVFIVALNSRINDCYEVNTLLLNCGFDPFMKGPDRGCVMITELKTIKKENSK